MRKSVAVSQGRRLPPTTSRAGKGIGEKIKTVSAIDFVDDKDEPIRGYSTSTYEIETRGYWRRIDRDKYGFGPDGTSEKGRTWIKAENNWRERPSSDRTVYVKASVASAKLRAAEYAALATKLKPETAFTEGESELYVLRCAAMRDEVYKVGWTSGTADLRAKELSAATGVPISFVVVKSWRHADAEGLEAGVHARLAPYRLNDHREFFQATFDVIERAIQAEIARVAPKLERR